MGKSIYRAMAGNVVSQGAMIAAARTTTGETNTTLFILRFTILSGATAPSYEIGIEPSVISNTSAGYDSEGEEIPMLISINGDEYPVEPVTGISAGTVTVTDGKPADTDGDGIPDQWERDNLPAGVDPDSPEALDVFSATGDYDHDGYSDVEEYRKDGLNDLTGKPYSPTVINVPGDTGYDGATDRRLSMDFDGDGHSDWLLRHTGGNLVTWMMADSGLEIEGGSVIGSLTAEWILQGTGDFDGDGQTDLLYRHTNGNIVVWLVGQYGTYIKSGAVVASLPAEWVIEGVGDLDGDGHSDLLLRHTNGNLVTWMIADSGLQIEGGYVVGNLPLDWSIKGLADFDGDSQSDLVTRHTNGNIVVFLTGESASYVKSAALVASLPDEWSIAGLGDFDGDGHSDWLLRHTGGNIVTWRMADDGLRIEGGAVIGALSADWTIEGSNDFDGDGQTDVLVRHSSNGNIAVLLNWGIRDLCQKKCNSLFSTK